MRVISSARRNAFARRAGLLAFASVLAGVFLSLLAGATSLSGASGPALARELTATRPDMKVLFVSGYSGDRVLQSGGLTEGQAFLQKPFALDALAVKVRKLLDGEVPALSS